MNEGLLTLLPKAISALFFLYLLCKCLDMILGIAKSWKNQNYRSRKMRDGIVRWIAELVAITFVIALDIVLGLNFLLCGATLGLFIYKEYGSIKENLHECGVDLPDIVGKNLEVFNKKDLQE